MSFNAKEVLARYKQGISVTKDQRKREKEALRFMVPEFQWSEQAKAQRNGSNIGGAAVPARPCLSISKIEQPIQLVENQFQSAHLGVNIHPISEKANKDTAEILQGIYRKIERDSNAVLPRGWAFDRAVEAGFGVYRVVTEYDDSSDNEFDQKILLKRILNQDSVIFDPSAQEPDYSDAEWAFITSYMPIERFKREFPEADISLASESELKEIMTEEPDWIKQDGQDVGILVSEYFCKEHTTETVTGESDGKKIKRQKDKVRLMWSKLAAGTKDSVQELEASEWNGQHIPLVPVIGKEMQVFDKDRRYVGIVEPSMDGQRGFNYAITTAIEIAALEPKAPFQGLEGQFEGHEEKYNQANNRNWGYLEHKPVKLEDGQIYTTPPQRVQIDASRLSVSMMLMDKFDSAIQATTYTPDPALGVSNKEDSGKKIEALQSQSMASTSNFMQNMAQISMMYESKVILDMIPRIYDRPGRIMHIIDFEDETQQIMLNAPFVTDPETGKASAASPQPPQMPPGARQGPPQG